MFKSVKQYRLPGFDYSSSAIYFITICTADRQEFFGYVNDGIMHVSSLGKLAEDILKEMPGKFNNARLDIYQIMPDHLHAIINLQGRTYENKVQVFKSGIKNNPMELKIPTLGKIVRWYKGRLSYEAHNNQQFTF